MNPAISYPIIGAGIGAAYGAGSVALANKFDPNFKKESEKTKKLTLAVSVGASALAGGVYGRIIGKDVLRSRKADEAFKQWQKQSDQWYKDPFNNSGYNSNSRGYSKNYWAGFKSDFFDYMESNGLATSKSGGPVTKADLKKQWKDLAKQYHPDRGGDLTKMQKINADWDKIKASRAFEKLAQLYL